LVLIASVAIVVGILGGCERVIDPRYAVYEEILSDYKGRRPPVVVCDETNLHSILMFSAVPVEDSTWRLRPALEEGLAETMPDLESSTLEAFKRANPGPRGIDANRLHVEGVRVAGSPCAAEMERHSDAQFVELSDVGVGRGGRQALVYMGVLDGDVGRGWLILLERTANGWSVAKEIGVWMA
jgi:hypothetical protein